MLKRLNRRIFHEIGNYKSWFINRFYAKKIPNDIDIVVSSIGGTATTSFIEFLSQYLHTNDKSDRDNLKHGIRYNTNEAQKIIFIISESEIAYKSLKRRKYLYQNCRKLGLISYFIRIKILFIKEVNTLQKNMIILSKRYPNKYLSIKFDDLFDSAQLIKDFTNLKDEKFIKNFPIRKKRLTD